MSMRPRPILVDMPLHIKQKIARHVDFKSRYSLRGCSKQFHSIVDTSPIVYDKISIVNGESEQNWDCPGNFYGLYVSTGSTRFHLKVLESQDRLLELLEVMFKNPKAHFVKVIISALDIKLQTLLTSQKHKISLENLTIQNSLNQEHILSVLQCLKPGVLEKLDLSIEQNIDLYQVFELEQWKQTKSIRLYAVNMENEIIPHVLHFQKLRLVNLIHLTLEEAKKIVESALKTGKEFRSFEIKSRTSMARIEEHFGELSFFDIPDSNFALLVWCTSRRFYLKKMEKLGN